MAKLTDLFRQIEEIRKSHPGGINFKNKTRFAGFSHNGIGGVPDVMLSIEMLESDQWGTAFAVLDKEFNAGLKELCAHLRDGLPADREVMRAGFDHPCRESCSGWIQGYNRGRFEAAENIEWLKKICAMFASASKNKHTRLLVESFKHHYDAAAERDQQANGKED